MRNAIGDFLNKEAASGLALLAMAVLALIVANSPLAPYYNALLNTPVVVQAGALEIAKPLFLWINDGMMAVFFFLVGLEVKREVLAGELSNPRQVAFPALAAFGGMLVPAAIFTLLNAGDSVAMNGWAIPVATDIAFALGILALFGARVPTALKVFLLTVAVLDDLASIVIIAVFYTSNLSLSSLVLAGIFVGGQILLNRLGVRHVTPYVLLGAALWVSVLKSGVHATLSGVVAAFAIPYLKNDGEEESLAEHFEHTLHPWVAYGVLPVFAFANAGVSLNGLSLDFLLEPLPLGIAAGLVLGKPIGVLGMSWLGSRLGLASIPQGVRWSDLFGVAVLCGIGFTMSLFIAGLAYEGMGPELARASRVGILAGTALCTGVGFVALYWLLPRNGKGAS
jgi:NhaA family Na+:H+ antiporter